MKRFIISLLAALVVVVGLLPGADVQALGSSTITFSVPSQYWGGSFSMPSNTNLWTNITDSASPTHTVGSDGQLGWYNSILTPDRWNSYWSMFSVNTSAMPAGVTVTGAKIRIYINSKSKNYDGWSQNYAIYQGNPTTENTVQASDGRRWYYGRTIRRYSNLVSYEALPASGWYEFDLTAYNGGDFSYILNDANHAPSFYLLTGNHAAKSSPYPDAGRAGYYQQVAFAIWSVNPAQLVLTYTASASPRTGTRHTNGATTNVTDGSEYTANITWETPRAGYKDDDGMGWLLNGGGGPFGDGRGYTANISLEDSAGKALYSTVVTNAIRTDGIYEFWLPSSSLVNYTSGFVRLHERNTNVYSQYGYLADAPSVTERTNDIYALSTVYPQYTTAFSSYVVGEENLMFVHWKTNVDMATENATAFLEMRGNGIGGESGTAIYSHSLGDLYENYYRCSLSFGIGSLHWRYAIFAMNQTTPGFKNYDGMVINLATPLSGYTKGFVQPAMFTSDNSSTFTSTQSAYWYLANTSEYPAMQLDATTFQPGLATVARATIPEASQMPLYLSSMAVTMSAAPIISTTTKAGNNDVNITAPSTAGAYYLRWTFTGSNVHGFEFIRQVAFTVAGTAVSPTTPGMGDVPSVSGWLAWINGLLQRWGMDNEAGHWLVIFVLAVLLAAIFFKHGVVATCLVVILLAGAFIAGWVNRWFLVLAMVGVGFWLYGLFKRKTAAKES